MVIGGFNEFWGLMRMVPIEDKENVMARYVVCLSIGDEHMEEPINSGDIVHPATVGDLHTT